jgi:hypothetical protein
MLTGAENLADATNVDGNPVRSIRHAYAPFDLSALTAAP